MSDEAAKWKGLLAEVVAHLDGLWEAQFALECYEKAYHDPDNPDHKQRLADLRGLVDVNDGWLVEAFDAAKAALEAEE